MCRHAAPYLAAVARLFACAVLASACRSPGPDEPASDAGPLADATFDANADGTLDGGSPPPVDILDAGPERRDGAPDLGGDASADAGSDAGAIDSRPRLTEIPCDPEMFVCCESTGGAVGRVVRDGIACLVDELDGLAPDGRGPIVEYRCVDDAGAVGVGDRIEARHGWPGCHGVTPACSFDFEHVVWDGAGWELFRECRCNTLRSGETRCERPLDEDGRQLPPEATWPDADEMCVATGVEGDRNVGFPLGPRPCALADASLPVEGAVDACYLGARYALESAHCDPNAVCVPGFVSSSYPEFFDYAEGLIQETDLCQPLSRPPCHTLRRHTPETVRAPIGDTQAFCAALPGYVPPCTAGDVCCDEDTNRRAPQTTACGLGFPGRDWERCVAGQVVSVEWTQGTCDNRHWWEPICYGLSTQSYWDLAEVVCLSDLECPDGLRCVDARCVVPGTPCTTDGECANAFTCEPADGGRCAPAVCDGVTRCEGDASCFETVRGEPNRCRNRLPGRQQGTEWLPYRGGGLRMVSVVDDCTARGESCTAQAGPARCYDPLACTEGACCDLALGQRRPDGAICEGRDPDEPALERLACGDDFTLERHAYQYRCNGRSADCVRARTVLETIPCPGEQRCFDDGTGIGCHTPGERCEPDGRCCLGYGVPAPGRQCGTSSLAEEVSCDPALRADQYRRRRHYAGCDAALACSTDAGDWTTAATVGWCGEGRVCERRADGTEGCSEPLAPEPCRAGACCDLATGEAREYGVPCPGAIPVEHEARCSADGSAVQTRSYGPACDGHSFDCGGPFDLRTYSGWETSDFCGSGASCIDEAGTPACVVGDRPCGAGACCSDAGTVRGLGEECYPDGTGSWVVAGTRDYCDDDWVWRRYLTWACDGSSPECPRSLDYRTQRSRLGLMGCERGCSYDSGAPACRAEAPSGADPCGTICLISATCGAGRTCLGGRCLPDGCTACPGARCVFDSDACTFLGCESATAGCHGPADLLTRTDFYAAGVLLERMEVDYSWVRVFEPVLSLRFRYLPLDPADRLPYDTTLYLTVRDAAGTIWYVRSDPALPEPGEWSYNASVAGGWGGTLCSGFGSESPCLDEVDTRAVFAAGICVTGFVVGLY